MLLQLKQDYFERREKAREGGWHVLLFPSAPRVKVLLKLNAMYEKRKKNIANRFQAAKATEDSVAEGKDIKAEINPFET